MTEIETGKELTSRQSLKKAKRILANYLKDYPQADATEKPHVTGSRTAFDVVWPFMKDIADHHEEMWALYLNRSNRVMACVQISKGGVSGTIADPKLIFQLALILPCPASCIILAHNHPSGNLIPSQADIQLTGRIKEGGKALEIQLLDHLIVTSPGKYYSFADEGLL
jgi:DNA repair protein RadC